MEIKIEITPGNKTKVLKLISELVDAESSSFGAMSVPSDRQNEKRQLIYEESKNVAKIPRYSLGNLISDESKDYLTSSKPPEDYDISGNPDSFPSEYLKPAKVGSSTVGTWYMFNSFFVAKAVLRVLENLLLERENEVQVRQLLETFYVSSKNRKLLSYRGFPKEKESPKHDLSSISKIRSFVIVPLESMGLVVIEPTDNKQERIFLTKSGLEFASLKNPILDSKGKELLSKDEISFLISHLKRIDEMGYKEYTLLNEFVSFLEESSSSKAVSYDSIVQWFSNNVKVVDWIYEGSRSQKTGQSKDSEFFREQLRKATTAFASGKIALLRELKVVSDKRGDYSIVGRLKSDV